MSTFFEFENGTISISLRSLTFFGAIMIGSYLLWILNWECGLNPQECNWDQTIPKLPTISDIVAKPFIDRVWCIATTFFTLVCFQCEIRAVYKRLYGVATSNENDGTFVLGCLACFGLPCLAYFDTHTYTTMHSLFCVIFFGGCGFYLFFTAGLLFKYKSHFDEEDHAAIDRCNKFRWIMLGSVFGYYFYKWFGPGTGSAFYEWLLVFMFLASVMMLSLTNKFYETVHDNTTSIKL